MPSPRKGPRRSLPLAAPEGPGASGLPLSGEPPSPAGLPSSTEDVPGPQGRPVSPAGSRRRHYAMWMFTGACPSRCVYCDIQSQQGRAGLSRDEVERVASEIVEAGFSEVFFVGGEALLSPDLPAALAILRGRVQTALFTGGVPGLAERAVKVLGEGGVDRIVLSIDSGDDEKNDRIRGRKGITRELVALAALAKERLPRMGRSVNTVVSRENAATLADVWDRMSPFALDSWALTLAGDSFEGSPGHAFVGLDELERLYFETIPDLSARTSKAGVELVVLPVPYPLLAAKIPPIRWSEMARDRFARSPLGRARTPVLAELELYSRGQHNATFVRKHGCPIVGLDVVIGVGGEVHPCSQAPIIDRRWSVGNVKSQPLADILEGPALRDFQSKLPHPPCTRCWAPSNIPRDALVELLARRPREQNLSAVRGRR